MKYNEITRKYIFGTLVSIVAAICVGLTGISFGTIITMILDKRTTNQFYYINIMLFLSFIFSLFSFIRSYSSNIVSEKISYDITLLLYDKLTKAKAEVIQKFSSSHINIVFIEDVQTIKIFLANQISFLVRNLVLFIGGMILMIKNSLFFFGILILTGISIAVTLFMFLSIIKKYTKQINKFNTGIIQHIFQGIIMQKVIQIFNPNDLLNPDFKKDTTGYIKLVKKKNFYRSLMFSVITFLALVSIVYSTYLGIAMVSKKTMTGGQLMSFLIYMVIVVSSLIGISNFRTEYESFKNSKNNINEILALTPHKNGSLTPKDNNIIIQNLYYKNIFNNFSQTIEHGLSTAIVGKSGSGKSKLMDLLLGFISPEKGNILIGDVKIEDIDIEYWHSIVSFCPQNTDIFDIPVNKNIFYGKSFDVNLYDKIITDLDLHDIKDIQNDKLSIGEKQRICIARTLLKLDAKVFIFDEPTSALDIKNTTLIFDTIKKYTQNKTLIIVTHEEALLQYFDKIINI